MRFILIEYSYSLFLLLYRIPSYEYTMSCMSAVHGHLSCLQVSFINRVLESVHAHVFGVNVSDRSVGS